MDRDAQAMHKQYKAAYKNRNIVHKRLHQIDSLDANMYHDIDAVKEKKFAVNACHAQM